MSTWETKSRIFQPPLEIAGALAPEKELMVQEKKEWLRVLGVEIDTATLPTAVTPEVRKKLLQLGFELRSIPQLQLGTLAELRTLGVPDFLKSLEQKYPNWKAILDDETLLGYQDAEHGEILPSHSSNLSYEYWTLVAQGRVPFPELPGQWVAVETFPSHDEWDDYPRMPMDDVLGIPEVNEFYGRKYYRFQHGWDQVNQILAASKKTVLEKVGLPEQLSMGLLSPLEWNLLGNREGWGETVTSEFTNQTVAHPENPETEPTVLIIGSANSGGAAATEEVIPSGGEYTTFRVAIFFEPLPKYSEAVKSEPA